MSKMLSYVGVLGSVYVATDENTKREFTKIWSEVNKTSEGISSGMSEINSFIDDLQRISFNLGGNQLSLNDLYVHFYDKVVTVWNSGEVFKVILSMIMLVVGLISLIVSPFISTILYIKNGIKNKENFVNYLRSFLLQVGAQASVGIIFAMLFIKFISL